MVKQTLWGGRVVEWKRRQRQVLARQLSWRPGPAGPADHAAETRRTFPPQDTVRAARRIYY
ncbi:hypothetical protein ACFW1M_34230, partial [Streptomyces inhibens]|uniref:hypothetical protein n=1 Tax=Streptomyces inhibens TaxID=2293571 RepID=UPI00368012A4